MCWPSRGPAASSRSRIYRKRLRMLWTLRSRTPSATPAISPRKRYHHTLACRLPLATVATGFASRATGSRCDAARFGCAHVVDIEGRGQLPLSRATSNLFPARFAVQFKEMFESKAAGGELPCPPPPPPTRNAHTHRTHTPWIPCHTIESVVGSHISTSFALYIVMHAPFCSMLSP